MLGCNDDARFFKEASVVSFVILDLVIFSCFFTIQRDGGHKKNDF